jgi:hypothetical protein
MNPRVRLRSGVFLCLFLGVRLEGGVVFLLGWDARGEAKGL